MNRTFIRGPSRHYPLLPKFECFQFWGEKVFAFFVREKEQTMIPVRYPYSGGDLNPEPFQITQKGLGISTF